MYEHDYTWSRGFTSASVFFFLLLMIAGALFFATYMSQRNDIRDLRQEVSQLKNQNNSAANSESSTTSTATYTDYTSRGGVKANVYVPTRNAKVTSPLAIVGEVPGSWSFEASFPVILKDSKGNVIAKTNANVLGNWMTNQLVPFSAKLTYTADVTGQGTLVLQKDNPSGQADKDDSIIVPVTL